MNTPVNPSFTISKWGVRGSSLHGHVCMMLGWFVSLLDAKQLLLFNCAETAKVLNYYLHIDGSIL